LWGGLFLRFRSHPPTKTKYQTIATTNIQKLLSEKKHSGKGFLGVWGPITLDYLLHMKVGTSSVRKPSLECFTFYCESWLVFSNLCQNWKASRFKFQIPLLPSSSINDASGHSIDLSALLSACLSLVLVQEMRSP